MTWLWSGLRHLVFWLALLPFVLLVHGAFTSSLGADPADVLSLDTGRWTLRFLLMSLAITPLRQITGQARLLPLRRTLGLYALFYACWHVLVYLMFLLEWRWSEIGGDIIERPYITVGFVAFVILVVLGATSNKTMMRRLGRNWKRLHRWVYLAAILGFLHLFWILRADVTDAVIYGTILVLLLGYRVYKAAWFRRLARFRTAAL